MNSKRKIKWLNSSSAFSLILREILKGMALDDIFSDIMTRDKILNTSHNKEGLMKSQDVESPPIIQ